MYQRGSFLSILLMGCYAASFADDPEYPMLQDMAPKHYEAKVEMVDQNQAITAQALETYDFEERRGRVDIVSFGTVTSFYYYNDPGQVLYIFENVCTVTDVDYVLEDEPFFGWINKDPLVVGPTALLRWPEKDPATYIGTKVIRGINCNQFTLLSLDSKQNVTIDYYFSEENWTTPFNKKTPDPVRIEINGLTSTETGKENERVFYKVNYVMDFSYFRPSVNDLNRFQPPLGMGCYNRDTGDSSKLPSIPKQFNFFAESFDLLKASQTSEVEVDQHRVWFDQSKQVARLDSFSTAKRVSQLFDFRTGVIYRVSDRRSCSIVALRDTFFETFDDDSLVGHMKEAEDVLGFVGDFYYMGEREMRGVKCKVLESAKPNHYFESTETRYDMFVVTVFFASDKFKEAVEGQDVLKPPVFILLTGYEHTNKITLQTQFSIYAFSPVAGGDIFQTFRLERCFPLSEQKSYFVLSIPSNVDASKKLQGVDSDLLEEARDKIIKAANITDIRLAYIKAEYLPTAIYITGLMLDMPSAMAQFWLEYHGVVNTIDKYETAPDAHDEESCAKACIKMTTRTCRRFHLCGKDCYLNYGRVDETSKGLLVSQICYEYIRSVSDSKIIQDALPEALKKLNKTVSEKKLKFEIPLSEREEDVLVPNSISISDGPFRRETTEHQYKLVFSGYQIQSGRMTSVDVPDAYTLDACYQRCKSYSSIACDSFSYCFRTNNKMCRLSSVFMDGRDDNYDELSKNENCDTFTMKYLEYYEQFPGKTILTPGEKQFTQVATTEQCAKNCRKEVSITCRGFEYCEAQKTCVLHSKHVLDLKTDETAEVPTTECIHYSAIFSADYTVLGRTDFFDNGNVRNEITLEECSRACSEEDVNCRGFAYCPASDVGTTDSTCSLISKSGDSNNFKIKPDGKCYRYAKRDNIFDWIKSNKPPPPPPPQGYTSGGLAGVIIGTLVSGIVVGALMFFAYSYVRSRLQHKDGMNLKLMKSANP